MSETIFYTEEELHVLIYFRLLATDSKLAAQLVCKQIFRESPPGDLPQSVCNLSQSASIKISGVCAQAGITHHIHFQSGKHCGQKCSLSKTCVHPSLALVEMPINRPVRWDTAIVIWPSGRVMCSSFSSSGFAPSLLRGRTRGSHIGLVYVVVCWVSTHPKSGSANMGSGSGGGG